ncbi:MAG: Ribosomal RNA large subunit methyltransferase J [Candidatus Celerinatantimonas neptuna]|nr:MAG: Ribosomal RNA large subunit methyltransferase J [Candidatus Celerinatantimonas neptuna]
MLSYRHSFHAGNFADIIKHLTLTQILSYLTQKDKAICYIDTHAGAGGYRLSSEQANKTGEYHQGIELVWKQANCPSVLNEFFKIIEQFNTSPNALENYPGSPWIAAHCLRNQDKLFLHELHPADFKSLSNLMKRDRRIRVIQSDGFQGAIGLLPPPSRRGLLFIDPPYELKEDYDRVVKVITQAHKRFATGCIALWYPVVERYRINRLEKRLKESGIPNIQLFELSQRRDNNQSGMTASGMIVINPPWKLKQDLESALPWLTKQLGVANEGAFRSIQLVNEA